ncbi:Glycine-rich domain-containing protein [Quillaja saponaria]|uniref:Glycine-rich domain-containing protein n=1 Tax=Quillaja saponaria TaxID=32244 RepID=A0AAD7LX02_QUISA|nr:Glycine-rich domain-containing protein [Quillaja saponaria]
MLEIVDVKDLPSGHKGSLTVSVSKRLTDLFFNTRKELTIFSQTGEKQVSVFQCKGTGEFILELISYPCSNLPVAVPPKVLATTSVCLDGLLHKTSKLSTENCANDSHASFLRKFLLIPPTGRFQQVKGWTSVVDDTGNEVISIGMRESVIADLRSSRILKKEVIDITASGEALVIAEFNGSGWSLMNSDRLFQLQKKIGEDGQTFELIGASKVIIFPGQKLEFETEDCGKQKDEQNFMTAVEFSATDPYGKAVALLDLESAIIKIKEEWLLLPAILSAFILSDLSEKKGYGCLGVDSVDGSDNVEQEGGEKGTELAKKDCMCNSGEAVKNTIGREFMVDYNEQTMKTSGRGGFGGCGQCGGGCGGGSCGGSCKGGGCGGSCRGDVGVAAGDELCCL